MPDDCTTAEERYKLKLLKKATKEELLRIIRCEAFGKRSPQKMPLWPDRPLYSCVRPAVQTMDGTTWSIQYSDGHYCRGTEHDPRSFEVWNCPRHPLLQKFGAEGEPYSYVPIDTLVAVLASHGGLLPLEALMVAARMEGMP